MKGVMMRDIHVTRGPRAILRGITAEARAARLTAVVGPNGAGKTTLLRCVAGVERPTSGQVIVDGAPIETLGAVERGCRVAWVPRPDTVPFPFTARETVTLGRFPRHRGHPGASDVEVVTSVMADVGIESIADRFVPTLSAGELQKVMMARALAARPSVLLADEPFANLDAASVEAMTSILDRVAVAGTTVVFSTHDLVLARDFADDVILLADGRVVELGAASDVLVPELIRKAYGVESVLERLSDGSRLLVMRHRARRGHHHA